MLAGRDGWRFASGVEMGVGTWSWRWRLLGSIGDSGSNGGFQVRMKDCM